MTEPFIYTDSKYGKGDGPIVYSNVNCHGWEKTLTECTKTNYLYFTCNDTAGVLCPDGRTTMYIYALYYNVLQIVWKVRFV